MSNRQWQRDRILARVRDTTLVIAGASVIGTSAFMLSNGINEAAPDTNTITVNPPAVTVNVTNPSAVVKSTSAPSTKSSTTTSSPVVSTPKVTRPKPVTTSGGS